MTKSQPISVSILNRGGGFIALTLVLTLLTQTAFGSYPSLPQFPPKPTKIPADLHKYVRVNTSEVKPNQSTVYILQDIHMNTEAQKNMAGAIGVLSGNHNNEVLRVGVEGSIGPFNYKPFQTLPDQDLVSQIGEEFVQEGLIGAVSYAGLTTKPSLIDQLEVYGIEDPELYQKNVEAARDSLSLQNSIQQELIKIEKKIETQTQLNLRAPLKNFVSHHNLYHSGKISIAEYAVYLKSIAPIDDLPLNLEMFIEAYTLEKALNFEQVERERQQILTHVTKKLSTEEIQHLIRLGTEYEAQKITTAEYYWSLKSLIESKNIPIYLFRELNSYIQYVLLSDKIDITQLMRDLKVFEKNAFEELRPTKEEREFLKAHQWIQLSRKLINFLLTPDEWEDYKSLKSDSSSWNVLIQDLDPGFRQGDDLFSPFRKFYTYATQRNHALIENFGSQPGGIIVAGGFHTPGLKRIFHQKNISPIVLTPHITKVDSTKGSEYLKIFLKEKLPLDKLFPSKKLTLAIPDSLATQQIQPEARWNAYELFFQRLMELGGKIRSNPLPTYIVVNLILTSIWPILIYGLGIGVWAMVQMKDNNPEKKPKKTPPINIDSIELDESEMDLIDLKLEWDYFHRINRSYKIKESPDHKLMAVATMSSNLKDTIIYVVDTKTKEKIARLKTTGVINDFSFSSNSRQIFAGSEKGYLINWKLPKKRPKGKLTDLPPLEDPIEFARHGSIRSIAFRKNGSLFIGAARGIIQSKLKTSGKIHSFQFTPVKGKLQQMILTPNEQNLLVLTFFDETGPGDIRIKTITRFSVDPVLKEGIILPPRDTTRTSDEGLMALSPDGQRLFVSIGGDIVRVIQTGDWKITDQIELEGRPVNAMSVSHDSELLALSPGDYAMARIYSFNKDNKHLFRFHLGLEGTPTSAIQFNSNGQLWMGDPKKIQTVQLPLISNLKPFIRIGKFLYKLGSTKFDPNHIEHFSTLQIKEFILYLKEELKTFDHARFPEEYQNDLRTVWRLKMGRYPVYGPEVKENEPLVIKIGPDQGTQFMEIKPRVYLPPNIHSVTPREGIYPNTATSYHGKIKENTFGLSVFENHDSTARSVERSPDGSLIAFGSYAVNGKTEIRLFDAQTQTLRHVFSDHHQQRDIISLAIRKDNRYLAAGSSDGIVTIWDLRNNRRVKTIPFHRPSQRNAPTYIWQLQFHPKLTKSFELYVAANYSLYRVRQGPSSLGKRKLFDWDHLQSDEKKPEEIKLHEEISSMAINPGGTHIAVGGSNGTVRTWKLASFQNKPDERPTPWAYEYAAGDPAFVSFLNSSELIVARGENLTHWDLRTNKFSAPFTIPTEEPVEWTALETANDIIVSGSARHGITIWVYSEQYDELKIAKTFGTKELGMISEVRDLTLSIDGKSLTSITINHVPHTWQILRPRGSPSAPNTLIWLWRKFISENKKSDEEIIREYGPRESPIVYLLAFFTGIGLMVWGVPPQTALNMASLYGGIWGLAHLWGTPKPIQGDYKTVSYKDKDELIWLVTNSILKAIIGTIGLFLTLLIPFYFYTTGFYFGLIMFMALTASFLFTIHEFTNDKAITRNRLPGKVLFTSENETTAPFHISNSKRIHLSRLWDEGGRAKMRFHYQHKSDKTIHYDVDHLGLLHSYFITDDRKWIVTLEASVGPVGEAFLRVWSVPTLKSPPVATSSMYLNDLEITVSGQTLIISGNRDGRPEKRFFEIRNGQLDLVKTIHSQQEEPMHYHLATHDQKKLLAVNTYNNQLELWNTDNKTLYDSIEILNSDYVDSLKFTHDGNVLIADAALIPVEQELTATELHTFVRKGIVLYDTSQKTLQFAMNIFFPHENQDKHFVKSIAVHPFENIIATLLTSGDTVVIDISNPYNPRNIEILATPDATYVDYMPSGQLIYGKLNRHGNFVIQPNTNPIWWYKFEKFIKNKLRPHPAEDEPVLDIAQLKRMQPDDFIFMETGITESPAEDVVPEEGRALSAYPKQAPFNSIVNGTDSGQIVFTNARGETQTFSNNYGPVEKSVHSPDGNFVATAQFKSNEITIIIWDVIQRAELATFSIPGPIIADMEFSQNNTRFSIVTKDGRIRVTEFPRRQVSPQQSIRWTFVLKMLATALGMSAMALLGYTLWSWILTTFFATGLVYFSAKAESLGLNDLRNQQIQTKPRRKIKRRHHHLDNLRFHRRIRSAA